MDFSKDSLEITQNTTLGLHETQGNDVAISAWERWMVNATRKEREIRKLLLAQKEEAELKRREELRKAKERRQKGAQCHKEWMEKKEQLLKNEREEKMRKLKEERLKTIEKEKEKKEKAIANYEKWCQMKDEERVQQKLLDSKCKTEQLSKQEERQLKAETAYKKWLETCSKGERRRAWWRDTPHNSSNSTFAISSEWIGPLDNNDNNHNSSC